MLRKMLTASAFLVAATAIIAQAPPPIDELVKSLTNSDIGNRLRSFYSLINLRRYNGAVDDAIAALLSEYPEQSDQIKLALITSLEAADKYLDDIEDSGKLTVDDFDSYWLDVIWSVSSLRDPRSAKALVPALGSGISYARESLADICPDAVDALVARSQQPDRYVFGKPDYLRSKAIAELGYCFTRVSLMRRAPEASAKARSAIITALDDSDPNMRQAAVGAVDAFRNDPEVKAKLERLAASDTYRNPGFGDRFTIREGARIELDRSDTGSFYVTRNQETKACQVQPTSEKPIGEQFIGPFPTIYIAEVGMCQHFEQAAQNPNLCWRVTPPQICKER